MGHGLGRIRQSERKSFNHAIVLENGFTLVVDAGANLVGQIVRFNIQYVVTFSDGEHVVAMYDCNFGRPLRYRYGADGRRRAGVPFANSADCDGAFDRALSELERHWYQWAVELDNLLRPQGA